MRSTIVPLHGAAIHAVRTPCVRLPSLRRLVSVFSAIPGRVRSRFGPCAQAVGLSSAGLPRQSRFQIRDEKKKKLKSNTTCRLWKLVSGLGIQTRVGYSFSQTVPCSPWIDGIGGGTSTNIGRVYQVSPGSSSSGSITTFLLTMAFNIASSREWVCFAVLFSDTSSRRASSEA